MNLGGGADNEQGLGRELFAAMKYSEVPATLHQLFAAFEGKRGADESFLQFSRRHEMDELRAMCSATDADQN